MKNFFVVLTFAINYSSFEFYNKVFFQNSCFNFSALSSNTSEKKSGAITYLLNDISSFLNDFNEHHKDKIDATSISAYKCIDYEKQIYYFKFDKGYAIIDDFYKIYEIDKSNPYYEEIIFYDLEFIFHNNLIYLKSDSTKTIYDLADFYGINNNESGGSHGPGVSSTSPLINLDAYIDNYYSEYNFTWSVRISDFEYIFMDDNTIFNGEQCCVPTAIYTMLYNTGKSGYLTKFFNYDFFTNLNNVIQNNRFYYLVGLNQLSLNDSNLSIRKSFDRRNGYQVFSNFSSIYYEIWNDSCDWGYNLTSTPYNYIPSIVHASGLRHLYDISAGNYGTGGAAIASFMDDGIPSILCLNEHPYYHNHAVTAYGVTCYSKNEGWGIWEYIIAKYFYLIDSSWDEFNGGEYFDTYLDGNYSDFSKAYCCYYPALEYSLC